VTGPDDRETPPKSSTPPDSQAWLPPRLRDKLDNPEGGDDDLDFLKKKSSPVGKIVGVVVVVALLGGGWWLFQNNQQKAKAAAAKAEADARAAAVADSLAQVRQADSLAAVARADSIAFTKLPKAEQRRILALRAKNAAGGSTAAAAGAATTPATKTAGAPKGAGTPSTTTPAEPAAPKEKGPFGIDAGQYLDEGKANEVAETLKTSTGLPAQVASMGEGTFHVLLGSFSSRAAAETRGSSLLAKGLVEQAAVVTIPKAK